MASTAVSGSAAGFLSGIYIYPIKSCRGIEVKEWRLDALGLRDDRRYMVVRPDGRFLTQRELPRLALVETALVGDGLRVSLPGRAPLHLVAPPADARSLEVALWGDRVRAILVGSEADRWFSEVLGLPARLVHFPAGLVRPVDPRHAPGARTGFADGFPLLLVGQASLDELNTRLLVPVSIDRFRPNLVVAGTAPYAEDGWRELRVGEVGLRLVKPCARCVVVTTDQASAERSIEPLHTLLTYRRVEQEVMFGHNAIHLDEGRLRVGDPVRLTAARL